MKCGRLNNVIWPLWFKMLFPPYILIPLIGNLIIDGLVIYLGLLINGSKLEFSRLRNVILKAWGFGFIADILGSVLLLVVMEQIPTVVPDTIKTLIVVILAGVLIGIFNYWLLKKEQLSEKTCLRVGIAMGVLTAPWLFLLPSSWMN